MIGIKFIGTAYKITLGKLALTNSTDKCDLPFKRRLTLKTEVYILTTDHNLTHMNFIYVLLQKYSFALQLHTKLIQKNVI